MCKPSQKKISPRPRAKATKKATNMTNCTKFLLLNQYTEVRFASFLSGGFTTMAVINQPEKKLAKRTSVQYCKKAKQ